MSFPESPATSSAGAEVGAAAEVATGDGAEEAGAATAGEEGEEFDLHAATDKTATHTSRAPRIRMRTVP
ncbi:hypothetical protein GCM10010170_092280 [Dactylosporangium salmoneum]|uniref:Uncharacterized protein n=1 Tax=Dactylosporangium salmoneum TaxID=53361 RepID=A0ABN3HLW3_9ACTN